MASTRRAAGAWLDSADPLTVLLWRQGDVLARAQALQFFSRGTVQHRLDSGRWRRAHRGVYVTHDGPLTRRQQYWIAYLSAGRRAYLAGLTAAELCGLRWRAADAIHVLIPAAARD